MAEHRYCCGVSTLLVCVGNFLASFILLFLRVLWGVLFIGAGLAKFADINQTTAFLEGLSFPVPLLSAYLIAIVETVGGLFLALGFMTRYAALLLLVAMGIAIGLTESNLVLNILGAPGDFVVQSRALSFFVAALVVFAFGPGIFSVDALIEKFYCKDKCH